MDLPHAGGLDPITVARALVGVEEDGTVGEARPAVVQLRAKQADTGERIRLVRALLPVMRAAGVVLIVDDDVSAGREANGVHLGQEDMAALAGGRSWSEVLKEVRSAGGPGFLIGLSTHTRAQVEQSAGLDVDYIGFGPIFPTRSKANPDPCVGLDALRVVCEISPHPVVAIGGIGRDEALRCAQAGAAGAAMISALVGATASEVRERAASLAVTLSRVTWGRWPRG
ncbi:MAG TPA: thiamine phosphate synthase [Nannocystis sp.]